jgi:DNA-binding sugar fermentation-stimulating protein
VTSIWREVADRVWVRRYAPLDQTIGVIGGEDGLVVIDTRATHPLADDAQDQVEQLAVLAELGREAASGATRIDEAIRRSPFPAEPTSTALERVRLELE